MAEYRPEAPVLNFYTRTQHVRRKKTKNFYKFHPPPQTNTVETTTVINTTPPLNWIIKVSSVVGGVLTVSCEQNMDTAGRNNENHVGRRTNDDVDDGTRGNEIVFANRRSVVVTTCICLVQATRLGNATKTKYKTTGERTRQSTWFLRA